MLHSACLTLLAACQPDPKVVISTNTPLPPAVSVATVTPLPSPTLTFTATTPPPTATFSLTPSSTPVTPTDTPTPTRTFTPSLTPTPTFTLTPTFTRTPYPTKRPGATFTPVPVYSPLTTLPDPHLWLARPIGEGSVNYVEATYRYGTTQNGSLQPHHGVEFYNPVGTPILAAADGVVVFAGPDIIKVPLSPIANFYGNVVVVELAQSINGQPIFNLYGHMSVISVKPGQTVQAGEVLGQVGGTGVARGGSHLHFEVRVGYNDYESTRNPELWLKPFRKWGALAGRVVDKNGRLIPQAAISVRSEVIDSKEPVNRFFTTYADETVNPDPAYGENFVIGDLPPGTYTVSVGTTKTYKQIIEVKPDVVTWVEFRDVTPPPTWTPTPTGTRYTSTPSATPVAASSTPTATTKP